MELTEKDKQRLADIGFKQHSEIEHWFINIEYGNAGRFAQISLVPDGRIVLLITSSVSEIGLFESVDQVESKLNGLKQLLA